MPRLSPMHRRDPQVGPPNSPLTPCCSLVAREEARRAVPVPDNSQSLESLGGSGKGGRMGEPGTPGAGGLCPLLSPPRRLWPVLHSAPRMPPFLPLQS